MTCLEQIYHPSAHNHLLYRAIHPLFLYLITIMPGLLLSGSQGDGEHAYHASRRSRHVFSSRLGRLLLVSGTSGLSLDDTTADC